MTKDIALYVLGLLGSTALGFGAGWFCKGRRVKAQVRQATEVSKQLESVAAANRSLVVTNGQLRDEVSKLKERVDAIQAVAENPV